VFSRFPAHRLTVNSRHVEQEEMVMERSKVALLTIALGSVGLSGCATEDYVDKHIAVVNQRIDVVEGRLTQVEGVATQANQTAQSAMGAATQANQRLDQLTGRVDSIEQQLAAKRPRG
jgi:outer membrane murein-binding lipoprotein Lpp